MMSNPSVANTVPRFRRVAIDWQPEPVSARLRFGLVALATDHVSESELHRMMPPEEVDLFATRTRHDGQCDIGSLRAMADGLAASCDLLLPGTPLDAIAYGCTSGTVAIGFDRVAATIRSQRPGVAVTTPISGAEAALRALGVQRIAMLTPYVDEVNALVADYLEGRGLEVTTLASFGLDTDIQMSTVPTEAIERAVLDMDSTGAEGVFICCTALRSVSTIAPLEQRLGLPVISSNQAMLWEMLRASGYSRPIQGYGRLMADLMVDGTG